MPSTDNLHYLCRCDSVRTAFKFTIYALNWLCNSRGHLRCRFHHFRGAGPDIIDGSIVNDNHRGAAEFSGGGGVFNFDVCRIVHFRLSDVVFLRRECELRCRIDLTNLDGGHRNVFNFNGASGLSDVDVLDGSIRDGGVRGINRTSFVIRPCGTMRSLLCGRCLCTAYPLVQ